MPQRDPCERVSRRDVRAHRPQTPAHASRIRSDRRQSTCVWTDSAYRARASMLRSRLPPARQDAADAGRNGPTGQWSRQRHDRILPARPKNGEGRGHGDRLLANATAQWAQGVLTTRWAIDAEVTTGKRLSRFDHAGTQGRSGTGLGGSELHCRQWSRERHRSTPGALSVSARLPRTTGDVPMVSALSDGLLARDEERA